MKQTDVILDVLANAMQANVEGRIGELELLAITRACNELLVEDLKDSSYSSFAPGLQEAIQERVAQLHADKPQ